MSNTTGRSRGRPSLGNLALGPTETRIRLGPIRRARLRRRATFETAERKSAGYRRTCVTIGDIIRRSVDRYLDANPPPGEISAIAAGPIEVGELVVAAREGR